MELATAATSPFPIEGAWVTPLYVYQLGVEKKPPTLALMRGSYENPDIVISDLAKLPNSKKWFKIKKLERNVSKD